METPSNQKQINFNGFNEFNGTLLIWSITLLGASVVDGLGCKFDSDDLAAARGLIRVLFLINKNIILN